MSGRLLALVTEPQAGVIEIGLEDSRSVMIVPGAIAADISPDGSNLAYVRASGRIMLRSLVDGSEWEVGAAVEPSGVRAERDCLTFSPDGTRLAFISAADRGLSVTTLDGVVTTVDTPQRATFAETGELSLGDIVGISPEPTGPRTQLTAELTCGTWLDPRRLVFDRVVTLPATLRFEANEQDRRIPADTTTVAVLDGPTQLIDSASRWRIEDSCGDYVMTEVEVDTSGTLAHYVFDGRSVDDAAVGQGSAVGPSSGRLPPSLAAFIDGSCDVLLIGPPEGGSSNPVRRYTPATGAVVELNPIGDEISWELTSSFSEPENVIFSPDLLSYAASTGLAETGSSTVTAFATGTGGSTPIPTDANNSRMLGWLPDS